MRDESASERLSLGLDKPGNADAVEQAIAQLTQPSAAIRELMRMVATPVHSDPLAALFGRLHQPPAHSNVPATLGTFVSIRTATDLGAMVKQSRKAMKLNQTEFAAVAGVGRRFLSELEGGKASLEFDRVMACVAAAGIDVLARQRGG